MTEHRERSETEGLIMDTTFAALGEHSDAALTRSKNHAEFLTDKSLLYDHYDETDEVLRALLNGALVESVTTDRTVVELARTPLRDRIGALAAEGWA